MFISLSFYFLSLLVVELLIFSSCLCFSLASGDRTPKQKVKLKVTEEKLLNLMLKYNGGRPRSEVVDFSF